MSRQATFAAAAALAAGLVLPALASARSQPPTTITVSAGDRAYPETPVSVELPSPLSRGTYVLQPSDGTAPVPAQTEVVNGKTRLTWIVPGLERGQTVTYRLVRASGRSPASPNSGVVVRRQGPDAEILVNGKLFTRYVTEGANKPYYYPLVGPTGVEITRHFPMQKDVPGETKDHPHHRSFWFTHGSVNGVDYWSEGSKTGKTVNAAYEALESGPVYGVLRTKVDWIAPDGAKVCQDVRELRVYNTAHGRMMDFDITVTAGDKPVTFGDTKEGSMGMRVASSMDVTGGKGHILNSQGDKDAATWSKRADWVDYWGPVAGKTVGIAMMDHPTSFRHPTYWHVRDYGLFAANPFGVHDFVKGAAEHAGDYTIPPGGTLVLRYRILLHEGDAQDARIADVAAAYANPPTVEMR